MIDKTLNILKTLKIPVEYLNRPGQKEGKPIISFHFFNEDYTLYGSGKGKLWGGSLQVDVFAKKPDRKLLRNIVKLLEENNFRYAYMNEMRDSTSGVRLYHSALIFNYIESEVLNESI